MLPLETVTKPPGGGAVCSLRGTSPPGPHEDPAQARAEPVRRPPELGTGAALLALGGGRSFGAQTLPGPRALGRKGLIYQVLWSPWEGQEPQSLRRDADSLCTLIPSSAAALARSKLRPLDTVRRCLVPRLTRGLCVGCHWSPGTSLTISTVSQMGKQAWLGPGFLLLSGWPGQA